MTIKIPNDPEAFSRLQKLLDSLHAKYFADKAKPVLNVNGTGEIDIENSMQDEHAGR